MKKTPSRVREIDTMRAEYDFTGGIRGKYVKRYASGTNVVVLEPDVTEAFPTARAVNAALRGAAHNRGLLLPGRATASQVAPAAIRDEHQCVCSPLAQQQSPISLESPELYL